jgi:uncharacterized protein YcbK (DUF882 family)
MRAFATLRDVVAASIVVAMLWSPKPEEARAAGAGLSRAPSHHALAPHAKSKGDIFGPGLHWAEALGPLRVKYANTQAEATIRLYRPDGTVDDDAARAFMRTLSDRPERPQELKLRTLQLVVKAAYHFKAKSIDVVSAFRAGRGPHGAGDAVDFRLPGTSAATLAAYLRSTPRTGIGVYTNPRTQYVHVDVREQSFHWLDASPPGKIWREAPLGVRKRDERDAAWTPALDLPDGARSGM